MRYFRRAGGLGLRYAIAKDMRNLVAIVALVAPLVASAADPPNGEVLGRAELPPKVEATFERQAGTQGLEHIRRARDSHGHVIYTAEIAGSGRIVAVTPDGSVRAAAR